MITVNNKDKQRLKKIIKKQTDIRKEISELDARESDTVVLPTKLELLRRIVILYEQHANLTEEYREIAHKQL